MSLKIQNLPDYPSDNTTSYNITFYYEPRKERFDPFEMLNIPVLVKDVLRRERKLNELASKLERHSQMYQASKLKYERTREQMITSLRDCYGYNNKEEISIVDQLHSHLHPLTPQNKRLMKGKK